MFLTVLIFITAVAGAAILVFHITIELNGTEKRMLEFSERIRKHYEPRDSA